jgi:DedD protein
MLFDRTPVAPTDDIALQIPDRDTPFEGRRGVPDATRAPLKASTDLPVQVAPAVVAPPTAATPPPADDQPAEKVAEKPAEKVVEKRAEKVVEKPEADVATKPVDKPAPKVAAVPDKPKPPTPTDDPKALAALEGRPDAAPAPTGDAGGKTYAVQIAAFSAADKARGLRDQLVAGGLKSYTESVSTPQGPRTRVRLGPFTSREAADRAKEKLKTMKLDGSVVPL